MVLSAIAWNLGYTFLIDNFTLNMLTLRSRSAAFLLSLVATFLLAGCAGPLPIPLAVEGKSSAQAKALLEQTQIAHGKEAFAKIKDISVSYDGIWPFLVTKIQPKITDPKFRKSSEDRILVNAGSAVQLYQGEGGSKWVHRLQRAGAAQVSVVYNGVMSTDMAVRDASHLVLESYQLFLLHAFEFNRAAWVEIGPTEMIDGKPYDTLVGVMRPGFGNATEDRAMLFIDQKTKLVKRVRLTLEGTAGTKGAVVDTTYLDYKTIDGVVWPVKFYEDLVTPFRGLPAHDFWITGLDTNRGLSSADFDGEKFSSRAAIPAKALSR
jgi:hypothetical protein